jgi:hypothetical protein
VVQQVASKVPFVVDTVGKCLCPKCPVQTKSQCVVTLKGKLGEALKRNPLKREEIPGAYCGTGKATCTDLDSSKQCICGSCAIFRQYKLAGLKPVEYYCLDGSAK